MAKLNEMDYPTYPDNCYSFDVASQTNYSYSFFRFYFDHKFNYSAKIFIEDRMLALKRSNPLAKFSTHGPTIANADFEFKGYVVEIEQEIFDEKDEDINCKDYPNDKFSTFSDCDQDYMHNWMEKILNLFGRPGAKMKQQRMQQINLWGSRGLHQSGGPI